MRKNAAGQKIGQQMRAIADGTPFTGAVTVYVTGDDGTQTIGSIGSGICTHKGRGYHSYLPSQAETNFDHVVFTFEGTGAMTESAQIFTSTPQTIDVQTRLPAALVGGRMDSSVGSNLDKSDYLLSVAGVSAILTTAMTEAYAADGAAVTLAQALYMIKQVLMEQSVSGTTVTVKKLDGTTTAMTFTLDSATIPLSITRAT